MNSARFAGERDSELVPDSVGDGHGSDGFGWRPLRARSPHLRVPRPAAA